MANLPDVSPEVDQQISQNRMIINLVAQMIEATHEYLQEWSDELSEMHQRAATAPVVVMVELANSVEDVAMALRTFRHQGVEAQLEGLADYMRRSEEAFQEMSEDAKSFK